MAKQAAARACATCPWLRSNQGKRHPQLWYTIKNIKRLWSGLRSGEAMICHATDPQSVTYGGTKSIQPGVERLCIGQLLLIHRSIRAFERACAVHPPGRSYRVYKQGEGVRMTLLGLARWAERIMFRGTPIGVGDQQMPALLHDDNQVGVPWDDDVLNVA